MSATMVFMLFMNDSVVLEVFRLLNDIANLEADGATSADCIVLRI